MRIKAGRTRSRNSSRGHEHSMKTCIVTGSAGLIGSEAVRFFSKKGFRIIGIDNDMRKYFFGEEGSTRWNLQELQKEVPGLVQRDADIRDFPSIEKVFQ